MNLIEISYIICACVSGLLCCGVCIGDIKEKYKKKNNIHTIRFPSFLGSYSGPKEPLINSNELGGLRDTAESITDDEEIRNVLRTNH